MFRVDPKSAVDEMNAYQLPFSASSTPTSPFNYFAGNANHSYVPRNSSISHAHRNMPAAQASFVSPPSYLPHHHQFSSFTSSVSSPNNANLYGHNTQYNGYGTNNSGMNANMQGHLDYTHSYSPVNLANASSYPYALSGSGNGYASYSQQLSGAGSQASLNQNVPPAPSLDDGDVKPVFIGCPDTGDVSFHQTDSLYVKRHNLPTKKAKKSGRGRGRRNANPSPSPENNIDRIFVWYIDETILFYLTMAECNRFPVDNATAIPLFQDLQMFINKFAEKYFFYDDLKDIDQTHIEELAADDNGQDLSNYDFANDGFKSSFQPNLGSTRNSSELRQKMVLRYRKIKETFSNYNDKLEEIIDKAEHNQLEMLLKQFNALTDNWMQSAKEALAFIKSRPNSLNILISNTSLINTLSKLMILGLAPFFGVDNIYSCAKTSKEHVLNQVLNRYGTSCTYIVVGKSRDEYQLTKKLELPFWPIQEKEHFDLLLNAALYYF